MSTPEGTNKNRVRSLLDTEYASAFYYMPVHMIYGKSGLPDFVCSIPMVITQRMVGETVGLFVGIETKGVESSIRPLQNVRREEILNSSGIVEICLNTDASFERMKASLEQRFKR